MAQKEFVSRVKSKVDTETNWNKNNPVLLDGEIVSTVVEGQDTDGNEISFVAFKVGDGVSNYASLPFTSANAWDVYDWAKQATKPSYDYSEIKNTPTIPSPIIVDQKYSATSKNAQSGIAVAEAIAVKVDKVDGKGLSSNDFTSTLLNKLNGIAEGANKYVHPSHTAHTVSGLYKITVDTLGHVTSATEVTSADLSKLGAVTTVDSTLSDTSTNPVQNKVVKVAIDNKQDKFADLDYVWNSKGTSISQLSLILKSASNTTSTGGVVSLIPKLALTNETEQNIQLTGIAAPTADSDAVNKKYVDTEVAKKQDTISSDTTLTVGNLISMGGVYMRSSQGEVDLYPTASNVLTVENGDLEDTIVRGVDTPVNNNDVANKKYVDDKMKTVVIDTALSATSTNPVQNKVVNTELGKKQATLVSGTNIKTINNESILGSGNISIPTVTVDAALSSSSKNPVQNQVINTALAGKTDLSASGASSLINKLSIGSDAPSDADYFVSQYAGGGTANTNYYRRPVSALNTYIKSKADKTPTSGSANLITSGAVYTALSGKASSTHTHTLNQVTSSVFNTTGSVDYISRSLIPYVSGTKFYGMPAAAITVEYSRDGGTTWVDYGLDDGAKMRIFDHSGGANLYLGKASTKADNSINNMLRITIDATKSDGRYLSTDSMFTWMSSMGNTTCVTLEVASYSAPTTFKKIVDSAPIDGWSGPNISHYGLITFGRATAESTSPNNQFYRLTYKQTAINSNHSSALICDIRFFGSTLWGGGMTIVNNMLRQGAPYSVRIDSDTASGAVNFGLLGATFGSGTSADGKYSLAGGINAVANHEGSIAYGSNLSTSAQYQAIFGKYNATSSTALFQVGNGTSTSSRKTAFNVFSDGHAEVQTQGTTDNSVVIKKSLDAKQDKFATVTTNDTVQTVKIGDNLSIVTSPNFAYSQISSTKILVLAGSDSTNSYVSLRKSKLENSCDFDATQGYLRVRDNPLADDFAVNKKYVTTAVSNKLDADTDNYNIAWDNDAAAIKITFK